MLTFDVVKADLGLLSSFGSRQLVELACSRCGAGFFTPKSDIQKSVRANRGGAYCSKTCSGKGPLTGPEEVSRAAPEPFQFQWFKENPERLQAFDWKEQVLLRCSACGAPHRKKREGIRQALRESQDGMYCSRTCACQAITDRALVVADGVRGRICKVCTQWRPLTKMMSRGQARTCFYCWPKRPQQLYTRYKRRAELRGYAFNLTYDEFVGFWAKPCTYCGDTINTLGLDRVDNAIGYEHGNIAPCCGTCNAMKMAQSKDDFLQKCRVIAARHPLTG